MAHDSTQFDAWQAALLQLASDIEIWAEKRSWLVKRDSRQITEDLTGAYDAPVLTIQTPHGRFIVQPVGLYLVGAGPAGRVDIYGTDLSEVLLTDFQVGWRVPDANRVQIADHLDEQTFDHLAQALTTAA